MRGQTTPAALLAVFLSALVVAGCTTPLGPFTGSSGETAPFEQPATDVLDESLAQTARVPQAPGRALPEAVSEALLPPIRLTRGGAVGDDERRYDVTVDGADARKFFMNLVEDTPFNVVIDPAVEGQILLALKDVTIQEVMEAVRDVYGYQFRRTSYGYHIMPGGMQTRLFEVDYLNIGRQGASQTRVSSGTVSEESGSSDTGSRITTSVSTNLWRDLTQSVTQIVGSSENRTVVAMPDAGLILVRALPAELRDVAAFLDQAEINLRRQVILEAKILEVTLTDAYRSGINWAQLASHDSARILAAQTGGGTLLDAGLSEIASLAGLLDPNGPPVPPDGSLISAFGGAFSLAIRSDDFAAFIELLETQGSVRTLSSPRISTLNNQKAVIKVGRDEFFVTDVSSTTVTGTATTTTPEIELTPFFSGIALDVTPQINQHGEIILHVHPSISEVRDQTKTVTIAGTAQTLPLALSTIRESDSVVRIRSGQVIVIGGLMQEVNTEDWAGTPGLSRIPFLGRLFRHDKDTTRKTELVILLRAIAVGPDTWRQTLEETRDRMERLERSRRPGSGN
ncbi:MAG: pilus (MSHA type) biogenesis protein MshL [Myxococcota bacterium]